MSRMTLMLMMVQISVGMESLACGMSTVGR